MSLSLKETCWQVITGPPCSGKTSVIEAIAAKDFQVAPEVARTYLKKLLVHESRSALMRHVSTVQEAILHKEVAREQSYDANALIFFDRALPDSLAYCRAHHLNEAAVLESCRAVRYERVFYLEALPFQQDLIRVEDEALAKRLGVFIAEAYREFGYELILVPVMDIQARAEFILDRVL